MFGEWTKVVKTNEKMKSTRYFFKSSRRNHDYAPNRKLNGGKFSPQQIFDTVARIKNRHNKTLRKRVLVLVIVMSILISVMILLNQQLLF